MRVKKDKFTKNEYIAAEGVWVRNFTKECVTPINLSPIINQSDYDLIINNESRNTSLQIANISDELIVLKNIIIISDGYKFKDRHKILAKMPLSVGIIAVNRVAAKWELGSGKDRRPINLYVVNNPYQECLTYLPDKYFPSCVASSRTNHDFVKRYRGRKFLYEPTPSRVFGVKRNASYHIDDYRNPICAAIGLAYHFKAQKVALMCCDDSFETEREGSVKLNNGLYTYPQHIRTQKIIDANLHWLTTQENFEVEVRDYSSGIEYQNASYIEEQDMLDFFEIQVKEPQKAPDVEVI
jgi:hypothetical protein